VGWPGSHARPSRQGALEWGRATLSIQIYCKTGINITIFCTYIALFKVKKTIIHRNQWIELRDIVGSKVKLVSHRLQGIAGRSNTSQAIAVVNADSTSNIEGRMKRKANDLFSVFCFDNNN